MRKTKHIRIRRLLGLLGLAVFLIIVVFPFYWQIVTSVKDPRDISLMPTELWPGRFSLEFYKNVFVNHNFGVYLTNSVIVAFGAMFVTLVMAFPAAYAFARIQFRFKKFMQNFILLANMFPIIAVVTPMFVIFRQMGLINTYLGLIIPSEIGRASCRERV